MINWDCLREHNFKTLKSHKKFSYGNPGKLFSKNLFIKIDEISLVYLNFQFNMNK